MYSVTAVPDLTWAFHSGDGGELVTAILTGGIPHPPGYPTYLLLGKMAALLPLEPIAYRFNLFSAVCGAIAAAAVTDAARFIGKAGWATILPGLTFAFVPLIWQQAIITEVYALNLAMVGLFVWSLLGERPSWLVGLLLGLCTTTHLTSLLLLPLAALLTPKSGWAQLGGGFLLGLTPYLLLPWLLQPNSLVVWGNLQTVSDWWWLVSGRIYQPNQLALPVNKMLPRLANWGEIWLRQFLFVGWVLLLWSGWQAKRKKVWLGLVGTAVGYLTYTFFYDTNDAIVLTLPAWLLLSLALTSGLQWLGGWSLLLPFATILLNFGAINNAELLKVRPFAEQIFSNSPANAILITSGDPDIFALWYFHHAEGQRPDLVIVDSELFAFDWYRNRLQQQYPSLQGLAEDDVQNFTTVNRIQRAVCAVQLQEAGSIVAQNNCSETFLDDD